MLRRLLDANRRLSRRIERHLPQARDNLFERYEEVVSGCMNERANQMVVDVGGGKSCPFAQYRRSDSGTRIVAVDISADEIRENRDVDEARVANIVEDLPFADGEAQMIVSRSVLEHLTDVEGFVVASRRVLEPGGWFIHLMPSRYAPFAAINRALPQPLSKRILYFFQPQVAGICGFPAFYDHTYASAITKLLERNGFDIVDCRVSYYQSRYFDFFVPAYLLSTTYELAIRALNARDLAAYVLVVARKRP
jgi:ubiquinone/menaquinone biosynthesis C-methylase UbiE